MTKDNILLELREAAACPVLEDYPLAEECTLRVGGPARYYCAPERPEHLREVMLAAGRMGLAWVTLGGGSNTLFKDQGYPGLVLSTRGLKRREFTAPDTIKAGSGALIADLTALTLKHSLSGLE
jgi:UDP-N-acetylmuramate dehydrogenase